MPAPTIGRLWTMLANGQGSLLNQARLVNRVLRRDRALAVSSAVSADWRQLRQEIARIRVTNTDLDADIDRRR